MSVMRIRSLRFFFFVTWKIWANINAFLVWWDIKAKTHGHRHELSMDKGATQWLKQFLKNYNIKWLIWHRYNMAMTLNEVSVLLKDRSHLELWVWNGVHGRDPRAIQKHMGGATLKGGGAMAPPKFWNFLIYIYIYI